MTSLLSLIPRPLAQLLLDHPGRPPLELERAFDGAVLFADIAGFTALSDALAAGGPRGIEELTGLLNRLFAAMIARVGAFGGEVWGFGGDALTVVFPLPAADPAAGARRAAACAWAMQREATAAPPIATSAGAFPLSMAIGLALGPLQCASAGDPARRLVPLLGGAPLLESAAAEQRARPGEVWLGPSIAALLPAERLRQEPDGFALLAAGAGLGEETGNSRGAALPVSAPAAPPLALAAYIHPAIAERLGAGGPDLLSEHRVVTALFARIALADGGEPTLAQARDFLRPLAEICHQRDGFLAQAAIGDKGSTAMVLFGAPIAHEDNALRALRCALDLRRAAAERGYSVAIGANTGAAFCGLLGSAARQDYTTIGDAINVAARLMEAARPQQIIAAAATAERFADRFRWRPLPPLALKGKPEPAQVAEVLEARGPSGPAASWRQPIIGRSAELERIGELCREAAAGRGSLLAISGEAGIGKSRLAAETARRAAVAGLATYAGECQSSSAAAPYAVWRPVWRGLFGLDEAAAPEAQAAELARRLELIEPRLARYAPLLGAVVDLPIPPTAATATLEPLVQKSAREALLARCLAAAAARQPLLITLEDCHWIDPLSLDLLHALLRSGGGAALIALTFRPGSGDPLGLGRLPAGARLAELRLPEFAPAEAALLLRRKLAERGADPAAVPEWVVGRLLEQAQGNPFYLEELLNYLHDRRIDLRDSGAVGRLEWPASLATLIISRIDQLSQRQQLTIKVASVIGRQFKLRWLWGVYPGLGAEPEVRRDLDELSRLDLTPLDTPEPEPSYLFRHIITHEVAYASLSYATRAQLHEQFGGYLEQELETGQAALDALVYHFTRSDNTEKQRTYLWRAGQAAQAAYANEAAIGAYRQLLPLLGEDERIPALLRLGEVLQVAGKSAEALECYGQALANPAAAPGETALCQRACGHIYGELGRYAEAIDWLERARHSYDAAGDQAGVAGVLVDLANIAWQQGRYPEAEATAKASLALWQGRNQPIGEARAWYYLGVVYSNSGRFPDAQAALDESLRLRREAGDALGVSASLNDLGIVAFDRGEYEAAERYYGEAYALRRDLGFKRGMGQSLSNLANAVYVSGDYRRARALLEEAVALRVETGHQRGLAISLGHLGNTHAALGDLAEAWRRHEESLAVHQAIQHQPGVVLEHIAMGFLALHGDEPERAAALFHRALEMLKPINDQKHDGETMVGAACVATARGRRALACKLFAGAERLLTSLHIVFEPEYRAVRDRWRALLAETVPAAAAAAWQTEGEALDAAALLALAAEATAPIDPAAD